MCLDDITDSEFNEKDLPAKSRIRLSKNGASPAAAPAQSAPGEVSHQGVDGHRHSWTLATTEESQVRCWPLE
ncbi:hypothetical protein EVAR_55837_1 [Eumeta japonica]|uniref:Uncharacterized protein n=1 Tax=Eumeta variegata TaxID=151549 RepID=A0A4C1YTA5_EUMVA|nr:hypothetical protein EVAR_55837_1 [Eumeta japonica]